MALHKLVPTLPLPAMIVVSGVLAGLVGLGTGYLTLRLRGVFFSIGYLGWFVDPLVFVLSTLLLLSVLVRRQFFSAARQAVIGQPPGAGKG